MVHPHHVGEHEPWAIVIAVQGEDGGPPYKVRWVDGTDGLLWPGFDAEVKHLPAKG